MIRTVHHFATDAEWLAARVHDITSTEAAALFGLSPYITEFELWHRKRQGVVVELPDNDRMRWGRRLQESIAQGIAEDEGIKVRALNAYMRLMPLRMGSSFDYEIVGGKSRGLLEIKKVDELVYRDKWIDGEAPEHIELQFQHQAEVADVEWGIIGVLVGGNRTKCHYRKRDRELGAAIVRKVEEFWASIEANTPPEPDLASDAAFISRLYGYAEPGTVLDARGNDAVRDICVLYRSASVAEDTAKSLKEEAKARMLLAIGTHERVLADGYTVSAGTVADTPPTLITQEMVGTTYGGRKGYRAFKLTERKTKERQ